MADVGHAAADENFIDRGAGHFRQCFHIVRIVRAGQNRLVNVGQIDLDHSSVFGVRVGLEQFESLGVRVLTPQTHEMEREGYRANAGDRCFFCKAELLDVLVPLADELGLAHVATGTNADDTVAGFRPGIRAAAEARRLRRRDDVEVRSDKVTAFPIPKWKRQRL